MDYKYIEQLLEQYFNAETTLEEEDILRSFFRQADIPAEMQQWKALFTTQEETLGEDFDVRILSMIEQENNRESVATTIVKARRVTLRHRLMPLFKAAAVVAIILTLGGAMQAPFDNSWNTLDDYANYQQELDSVSTTSPIQAENISDIATDSTRVLMSPQPKN